RPTVSSTFWQRLGQRFADLRQDAITHSKRPMDAAYHPDRWGFENVPALRLSSSGRWHLSPGSATAIDEFQSIAGLCAVALGAPNPDAAWAEWLDCLRRDSLNFDADHLRSDLWAVESRPEPNFEVVARGLLYPPPEVRPDPDPVLVEAQIGDIDDVCA